MCTIDYAVVIVMAVFIFASASWVISARKWFTGPIRQIEEEQMAAGVLPPRDEASEKGSSEQNENEKS